MFRMEDILDGGKEFKREGAGITTNGISALVHFILHRNRDDSVGGEHDEMDNLLSVEQLSLTSTDNDDDDEHIDAGKQSCFTVTILSPQTIHSHHPIRHSHCHHCRALTEHG